MTCVACWILLEDPLAGVGTEGMCPTVARNQPRGFTDRRATQGNLANVAHNKERFLVSEADVPPAHILGDGLPIRAKSIVPAGVLGFQPLALRNTHTCIRIPPDGWSLVPDPQVECVMEPV